MVQISREFEVHNENLQTDLCIFILICMLLSCRREVLNDGDGGQIYNFLPKFQRRPQKLLYSLLSQNTFFFFLVLFIGTYIMMGKF